MKDHDQQARASVNFAGHGDVKKTPKYRAAGMSDLGQKWARVVQNGTNLGLFQIRFQYILAQRQNVLKSDLKKSRICPIWGQSDPFWVQI